ncbi:hypothetical protein Tco_0381155, partial [Tanacetum coccineum]
VQKCGGNMSSCTSLDGNYDKVKSRLSNWKIKSLSMESLIDEMVLEILFSHNDSLWTRVLNGYLRSLMVSVNKVSKYVMGGWGGYQVPAGKIIKNEDQEVENATVLTSKPLKLLFPRIYALDNIKDASICMKLNEPSLDNNFRRSIRGGIEQSSVQEAYGLAHSDRS